MITLNLEWREVLWRMQGGMAGSHLRWNVYEDMVNRVWPQCSEQERRNMWLIMRRDLGTYWRPDGWNGHSHMQDKGEGPWKPAAGMLTYSDDQRYDPTKTITDVAPWDMFRRVLARFDPDNQYAVKLRTEGYAALDSILKLSPSATFIRRPSEAHIKRLLNGKAKRTTLTVRTYKWQDEYRIDWSRRCAEDAIVNVEKLEIPDEGTM